ncbi:unnamed protein product [Candida verbasci]|uniref:Major facilitator superfamily (MFS) profile domain-containing protein n=1 Tax=Candida verbasci TaxID=1227364 RepID=A0A9W4X977_9ASCO|nr:unnamed protein product [Candida verbasci]
MTSKELERVESIRRNPLPAENLSLPIESDIENQQQKEHFKESDAGDGTTTNDQYLHGLKLGLCFFSLFLCLFLFALDQTIVVTILTTVGNQFDAFDKVGWLSSGFLLTMAVFIQPFGKLSIIFGRRWVMVAAIILFEAGSLMCALAPTMNVLIGGRVLAGIGGSGIQGLVFVIVSEVVPIDKRPIGMAIISVTFAVASVLGPLIGGAFTSHATWRWAFYINLPIGGFALVVFLYSFRPPTPRGNYLKQLKEFDYLGTCLLIAGCVLLLLAITFGAGDFAWDSAAVIVNFILGPVLLILFCIWNFRFSKNQVIATPIIKSPQIVASTLSLSGVFTAFIVFMIYGSIYFQVVKDASAIGAGLHLLPCIISVVLSSIFSGIMIQKFKYVKPFNVASAIIAPIGCGLLCLLDVDTSFSKQVGYLILIGVGAGLQMQPAIISAQIKAPKSPGGMIMTTVFINFFRSITSALGADLSDAVYQASFNNIFKSSFNKLTNESIKAEIEKVDIKDLSSSSSLIRSLSPEAEHFVKSQIVKSIRNVFYMCLGFSIITVFACVFITNQKLPDMSHLKDEKKKEDEKDKVKEDVVKSSSDEQRERVNEPEMASLKKEE